jgi:hypothetical protein
MDGPRFDDLARSLSRAPSRRSLLKTLAGAALGVFASRIDAGSATAAQRGNPRQPRCTSDADCGGCGVCQDGRCRTNDDACPACARCDSQTLTCRSACRRGELCCGETGTCGPVGVCCALEDDCGPCQDCVNGTCVALPYLEGRECGDCKRCRNGACSQTDPNLFCAGECCDATSVCSDQGCCDVSLLCGDDCLTAYPDHTCVNGEPCPNDRACGDVCCGDGQSCDLATQTCCPHCLNDACCPSTHACVNPGLFSANFCCDARVNTPCGGGNGTFAACCSNANEECCDGECVPIGECCATGFGLTASNLCCQEGPACGDACCGTNEECRDEVCVPRDDCPEGQTMCPDGWDGFTCCGSSEQCCNNTCIPAAEECCEGVQCQGECCAPEQVCCDEGCCTACGAEYCLAGEQCCNGSCRPIDELCCQTDQTVCGDQCCGPDESCGGHASDPNAPRFCCASPTRTPCIDQCCPDDHRCCIGSLDGVLTSICCAPGLICNGGDGVHGPTCCEPDLIPYQGVCMTPCELCAATGGACCTDQSGVTSCCGSDWVCTLDGCCRPEYVSGDRCLRPGF